MPTQAPVAVIDDPASGTKASEIDPATSLTKKGDGMTESPEGEKNDLSKSSEGAAAGDVDLVAEAVATATEEVDAASKDSSKKGGSQCQVSPAVSEGSGAGAAAVEVIPVDSTPASAENTPTHESSKRSKKKEDKSIGEWET